MLVDDYKTSEEYARYLASRRTQQDQLIELYRERYEKGLAIFTGEPLPCGENSKLGEDDE